MKRLKQALSLGMAGVMMTAAPVTAFAASPEFSRSAEEWAKLRDNTIEYDELEGLIQEYNATVQTNNLDLAEFKRKYGDTMSPPNTVIWQMRFIPALPIRTVMK